MSEELTFESINQGIEETDFSSYESFLAKEAATASLDDVLKKLCGIWKKIRPILKAITKFVPKKWKLAINTFIGFLDQVCSKIN